MPQPPPATSSGLTPALPRIIVVEDDASVRSYVSMALEDMALELVLCTGISEALQALQESPACLVLTDLMLNGESGLDLLEMLAIDKRLAGSARLAVFSAGVNGAIRQKLEALPVWRILSKPVSLNALEDCVRDAIAGNETSATPSATPSEATRDQQAIAEYFGGSEALYASFKSSCQQQFLLDIQIGDAAVAVGDEHALHRLAHGLKSVLRMLGKPVLSELAQDTENAAGAGDYALALELWRQLRASLPRPPAS
jgi:CheY-like chemotaxis protein